MIQRIQSIWLFLAALSISCLLFLPMITSKNLIGVEFYIIASGLYQKLGNTENVVENFYPLLIGVIAVVLLCIANIFNYKKRDFQKKTIYGTIVLIMALSFWCSQYAKRIPGGIENSDYEVGLFLPPLAIAFCLLAVRGISRDQKLLKSADRLR